METIYGSRKAITFIDIPEGHPLEELISPFTYLPEADFKENLEEFGDFLKDYAERQKKIEKNTWPRRWNQRSGRF